MKSKVKEYQKLYREFENVCELLSENYESKNEIDKEIKEIQNNQKEVEYNNTDIIVRYMEEHVENSVVEEKEKIRNSINSEINEVEKSGEQLKNNYSKAEKWLSTKKTFAYLNDADIDYGKPLNAECAKQMTKFNIMTVINKILSFVFRLGFINFLPKVIRCFLGALLWFIFLIISISNSVYNIYENKYNEYLSGLSGYVYDKEREIIAEKIVITSIATIFITIFVIIALNIFVYFMTKHNAKKYLIDNAATFMSIVDKENFTKKMFNYRLSVYMDETVSEWKKEIDLIKRNGLDGNTYDSELYSSVKELLEEEYNNYAEEINTLIKRKDEILQKETEIITEHSEIAEKLKQKEKEVNNFINDKNYNNAVLTPYVSMGYSQYVQAGVKELVVLKHNYKPVLISYNEETGDRFRKNAAMIIELLMNGFYKENYCEYINMSLVDFEGLYFPKLRRSKFMKVIRSQNEMQELFNELKKVRKQVDSWDDGRIGNINPNRLMQRENPVKYNIIFFIGNDFNFVDMELSQLFITGENFGFLPIIFMKDSMVENFYEDKVSSKSFSSVIRKIKDNNQEYDFEALTKKFEYGLMVSNRKKLLDEKLCVNKILSVDDFVKIASSEDGLIWDEMIYVDTYELSEELYDILKEIEGIVFFTINNKNPEYIPSDEVINL